MNGLSRGSWDCHAHVFDPRFPYAAGRDYSPGPATAEALRARHAAWGVDHAVLVQPSVYGTDNACLLDALCVLGPKARGVAVVDPDRISDDELADMQRAGVRGIRVNLVAGGGAAVDDPFARMARRLRGTGLFMQVYAPQERILDCRPVIETAEVPVVLDHFAGGASAVALEPLLRNAPVWVKLSADYRLSHDASIAETAALDLIGGFHSLIPDRLIWGSDWPHTGGGPERKRRPPTEIEPFRQVYSLSVPQIMADAGLDDSARTAILTTNPARLFDAGTH